jgi:hypothetical protein
MDRHMGHAETFNRNIMIYYNLCFIFLTSSYITFLAYLYYNLRILCQNVFFCDKILVVIYFVNICIVSLVR